MVNTQIALPLRVSYEILPDRADQHLLGHNQGSKGGFKSFSFGSPARSLARSLKVFAELFMLSVFQLGGIGARATKDGLNTIGFPSSVAGVPAEVIETLAPLVQPRHERRMDSGGAGEFRGGLGQTTEISYRAGCWSVSAMIDRTQFAAQGWTVTSPAHSVG